MNVGDFVKPDLSNIISKYGTKYSDLVRKTIRKYPLPWIIKSRHDKDYCVVYLGVDSYGLPLHLGFVAKDLKIFDTTQEKLE